MSVIPKQLQGVLWSADVDSLDLKNDQVYIVHQILRFGKIDHISWLIKTYGPKKLKEIFLHHPKKIYTPSSLNFAKNTVLGLEDQIINSQKYVQAPL